MGNVPFCIVVILLSAAALSVAGDDVILGETPGETGAVEVMIMASTEPGVYADLTSGEPVKNLPGTGPVVTTSGGVLSWHEHLGRVSASDAEDVRYFELWYSPPAGWWPGDEPPAGDRVRVSGGGLAFYSTAEHRPFLVSGARYLDIPALRRPELSSPRAALAAAAQAAARAGLEVASLDRADPKTVERLVSRSELRLHPVRGGREFGFVWHLPVLTTAGGGKPVILDASDGTLLAVLEAPRWNVACDPVDSTPQYSVTGVPQRSPLLDDFMLVGTPANAGGWFCAEAHIPQTATRPSIQVLRTTTPHTALHCDPPRQYYKAHAVCPNQTGAPRYDNIAAEWLYGQYTCEPGRAVTDALRHSKTTFDVLWSVAGYQRIYGSGVPFRVVVDVRCDVANMGAYYRPVHDDSDPQVPAGAVGVCGGTTEPPFCITDPVAACAQFNSTTMFSAALDIMAHEIGHGVISATAGLAHINDPSHVGTQLHEGFADVIGHAVEWLQQPTPQPAESPDWLGGEDKGSYDRRVDVDEGNLRFFHQDTQHDGSAHAMGTLLPVAFRLLAEGGVNPACGGAYNQPSADICMVDVGGFLPGSVGVHDTFRVFFRLLDVHVQPSTGWSNLPNLVIAAAGHVEGFVAPVSWQGRPVQPCYQYSPLRYAAWQSMAAVGLPGIVQWCSVPG